MWPESWRPVSARDRPHLQNRPCQVSPAHLKKHTHGPLQRVLVSLSSKCIHYFVLDVFLMIIIGFTLSLMFCDPDLLIILMFSSTNTGWYRCFPATNNQFLIGRPRTNDELKLENGDVASLIGCFLSASKHKRVCLKFSAVKTEFVHLQQLNVLDHYCVSSTTVDLFNL